MFGTYLYKKPIKHQSVDWKHIDTIIIDEISMVGPDYVDYIDFLLRNETGKPLEPFGGIQMIFVGDKAQLPPVYTAFDDEAKQELADLKKKYGQLTFDKAYSYQDFVECELTEIKRQNDDKFISILNRLRDGDMSALNELKQGRGGDDYTSLKPFNTMVDKQNNLMFSKLPGAKHTFEADIIGTFNLKNSITPQVLELKVGAKVMITKNMQDEGLVNGDMGKVTKIGDGYISFYSERLDIEIDIERKKWKEIKYEGTEEVEVGTFTQYPMKLAYALSIHKSQGLTLDKVSVTVTKNLAKELVYVAVSRATNMEHLYINQI